VVVIAARCRRLSKYGAKFVVRRGGDRWGKIGPTRLIIKHVGRSARAGRRRPSPVGPLRPHVQPVHERLFTPKTEISRFRAREKLFRSRDTNSEYSSVEIQTIITVRRQHTTKEIHFPRRIREPCFIITVFFFNDSLFYSESVALRQVTKGCNCMCSRRGWVYGWVGGYIIVQLGYQTLWSITSK
jgi:hypothetical protein